MKTREQLEARLAELNKELEETTAFNITNIVQEMNLIHWELSQIPA